MKAVDLLIHPQDFDEIVSIVSEGLKISVSRLQDIDINRIDKEAQLPLNDLARVYNYSSDYLRNLINRGQLKGYKKGKTWYVRVRDMAEYSERLRAGESKDYEKKRMSPKR